jgi:uridine kinase
MKGDIVILENYHIDASEKILTYILPKVLEVKRRYILTVSGESGSGKSEMAKALSDALENEGINCVVLGQDDYFILPPKSNDIRRREDDAWLGPHVEVNMELLNQNILDAFNGEKVITKPLVNYSENSISEETINMDGIKVVIIEGTYTALLRHVDCRIFINRNRLDTMEHRKKRNRGNEANDAFVEDVLKIEHKIIAGHQYLVDIIISKDYQVSLNP